MVRLAPSALLPALVSALLASLAQSVDLREEYRVERAFTARGDGPPSIHLLGHGHRGRRPRRSPLEENPEDVSSHGDLPAAGGGNRGPDAANPDSDDWDRHPPRDPTIFQDFDVPQEKINQTIRDEMDKNNETTKFDDRKYYEFLPAKYEDIWVDLDLLNNTGTARVHEHEMLSKSYRRAATIPLNFRFPFYGHDVRNITIATGGFLYTGKYVHSWLAATQYIAPLMANFDTSQDPSAKIRYADNGTALIVEWSNVHLQGGVSGGDGGDGAGKIVLNQRPEKPYSSDGGSDGGEDKEGTSSYGGGAPKTDGGGQVSSDSPPDLSDPLPQFTFQAILTVTGDIFFAYKSVPIVIDRIEDAEHPVKVGLSDAYIIDRTIFFVRRKTIYEYHRVSLTKQNITSNTAIYFKALSTCNRKRSCNQCLGDSDSEDLKCKWCPNLQLCSDGLDRNRQDWLNAGCDSNHVEEAPDCERAHREHIKRKHEDGRWRQSDFRPAGDDAEDVGIGKGKSSSSLHAGLVGLLLVLLVLATMAVWLCYAYFFPHTWSGQVLIKYRPTRWHWLRSEPRYTAASIHM